MFFTIIIPIYNSEKTLDRCLESVQNQIFKDYQVILVDDGSQDSTPSICSRFVEADDRFKYIRQNNQGVSSARNKGLECAEGEYITFLDSDDVYFPNYLEEFKNLMLEFPEHDSYWCGFQYILANNVYGEKKRYSAQEEVSLIDKKKIMDLHEKTLEAVPFNKVYNRKIISNYTIVMKKNLSLGEDLLFNYEYLDKCENSQIVILNKELYGYYCTSEDSLNCKYRKDLKEVYEILNAETLKFLLKWQVDDQQLRKYYNSVFWRMDKVLRNTFRKECVLSKKQKYAYNNALLRSTQFKDALRKTDCYIHPLHRIAYSMKNYHAVQLIDFLAKALKK